MKASLGISNFLEEISIVFLYFFALIAEEGFLISPCYSLELCIKMGISFLFSFVISISFLALCKTSSENHFSFLHFSWGWSWALPPVQCHESLSIVLQALCLSDLIHWIWLSLPSYNCNGFDLGHTWLVFPIFFNLSLNFAIRVHDLSRSHLSFLCLLTV